jgi:hypothetical protein
LGSGVERKPMVALAKMSGYAPSRLKKKINTITKVFTLDDPLSVVGCFSTKIQNKFKKDLLFPFLKFDNMPYHVTRQSLKSEIYGRIQRLLDL